MTLPTRKTPLQEAIDWRQSKIDNCILSNAGQKCSACDQDKILIEYLKSKLPAEQSLFEEIFNEALTIAYTNTEKNGDGEIFQYENEIEKSKIEFLSQFNFNQ